MRQIIRPRKKQAQGDCFRGACAARAVLSHLSSRWGVLILAVFEGTHVLRFSIIRDRIEGISEKVLAQKLRELERDGLLARKVYPVVPPHVEYRLTPLGQGVATHVEQLITWIEDHVDDVTAAQKIYDHP